MSQIAPTNGERRQVVRVLLQEARCLVAGIEDKMREINDLLCDPEEDDDAAE